MILSGCSCEAGLTGFRTDQPICVFAKGWACLTCNNCTIHPQRFFGAVSHLFPSKTARVRLGGADDNDQTR